MSQKRGMFEHETFTNFLWFAILLVGMLIATLVLPQLVGHARAQTQATPNQPTAISNWTLPSASLRLTV